MAKSWLVDCRGIAKKVRNATLPSTVRIKDCGAKRECPNCHNWIDNSDVSYEWPGLPAGVKFDPSDAELLGHLSAKCGVGDANAHIFIDEFIPTLERGICYTHPENLPGASEGGTSVHFFHKTANAYASGQRKRRKIESEPQQETVRWHKTGKTKPVFDNGIQKGCKKIMVLYRSSQKGSKPVKSNWVMHQYHLGTEEDEREGEYVVSKIFYQQHKQNELRDDSVAAEDSKPPAMSYGPKTPMTHMANPPRESLSLRDDVADDNLLFTNAKKPPSPETVSCFPPTCSQKKEDLNYPENLAGESQAVDPDVDDNNESLLCKEIFSSCTPLDENVAYGVNDLNDGGYDISGLEDINIDSLPDYQDNVPFGSQESILDWLNTIPWK